MGDKNMLIRAFNNHFFEFLKDIISIYPENDDIINANASFELIKRANPTVIIKAWHKFVYLPYSIEIANGNIDFFINKDYGSDLVDLPNSNDIMKMIDNIRVPIRSMNVINKAHSATYIQNLCKISNRYNELSN